MTAHSSGPTLLGDQDRPFIIDSPTCISFSGGRTSAYMLWRVLQANGGLPAEAVVCFANTGKEEEATLEFVRDCGVNWGVPITWVEYRDGGYAVVDFDSASRDGEPFAALIKKRNYLPNPVARFCTAELKIKIIDKHMQSLGFDTVDSMLGIRSDEQRRSAKMMDKVLPLVRAGITQSNIQAFWNKAPFDLGLPFNNGITPLGNCDLCFLKGASQILSVIADTPSRAVWWAKQEEAIGATFRSDRPSYAQMLRFSQEQRDMFDPNEEAVGCFCGD
jgi:3'-phosphoadenosine 5'-phosphosulfate sulfotransferase (PAPS reductase)/FAD synthetase